MSDYIKREDAIREAVQAVDDWDGGYITSRDDMIEAYLNDIPAADVVEVTRCKNCEYYEDGYCCFGRHVKKYPEEYCSDSDRKMYDPHEHTMTNLEWLRTAPEDDLIAFLWVFSCPPGEREKCPKDRDCRNCWRDWLKKEVER